MDVMHKGLLISGILLFIAAVGLVVTSAIFHQWVTLATGIIICATMIVNLINLRNEK